MGFAPVQRPDWHVSARVQALPSSHPVPFGLGAAEQAPVVVLQVPRLQASSSELQLTGVPALHAKMPRSQVSTPLQALPSSQSALLRHPQALGSNVHWPVVLLQLSAVHTILSSQMRAGPPQTPLVHVSGVEQNLPSSHGVPFALFGLLQAPVLELHVPALWHWSRAVHWVTGPPVQTPFWHVSLVVQALPSSQPVPLGLLGSVHTPFEHEPATWH
jgi:hypothetical protein